ncbi:aminotransferase class I/II-fold pyridoxal phosphate-dependent enzyme [Halosimplex rubrum]|uniref:Aminotransferase class I/II-fold pyridoxal phosphate-dependent enzyme n=1 Tax=Halosimplex rubrum TaxID=869889 RepID=A0A7D5P2G6_9EURY|nr:GntG family PLP-dependent aldolase [Halosimplex rubrum]QLH76444.1 aminotransferase class I/II-fold pyridoxal phosphate-dependent enzyme [Halosimplex rubrum]
MIDLRSDTVTKPDEAMREAARDADVGDDVYGEDPTVNELETRVADVLGFDDALLVPSGTMGNQVAVRTHTERGQEAVLERESHVYKWELGGVAQHSGVQTRPVDGDDRGVISAEQVREAYVPADGHRAGTGLLALENTHNSKGGTAIAPEAVDAAAGVARERDVPVHLDGARLFNAAAALDTSAERIAREVDSAMVCLSKGLGAPVGSVLAGSDEFVERARRHRKLMGGGMRQAGILAAPGLRALENRDRLAADHERARRLAAGLDDIPGVAVPEPETNIVVAETADPADEVVDACEREGVGCVAFGDYRVRFCTHWDVDDEDIDAALSAVERAVE